MHLSVVIPVYNEEKNISIVHERVTEVLKSYGKKYEIIFVDDGSTDGTFGNLMRINDPNMKIIKFRKNFGQTAAMDAGLKHAKGELIAAMDGDLQNDPADIPRLIRKLEKENLDVVSGWRKNRKDTLL